MVGLVVIVFMVIGGAIGWVLRDLDADTDGVDLDATSQAELNALRAAQELSVAAWEALQQLKLSELDESKRRDQE